MARSEISNTRPLHRAARTPLLALLLALVANSAFAQSVGPILGPTPAQPLEAHRGELLLSELNCVACHAADPAAAARLKSRPSPVLGKGGLRLTPQYLKAYLSNPSSEKPGTTMPDMLAGLAPAEKAEAAENLAHYLISLAASPAVPAGADSFKLAQGRMLYHQVGCVACHAPQEAVAALRKNTGEDFKPGPMPAPSDSVPLGNLAKKTTLAELTRFLMDPLQSRPGGRMPSLNLGEAEAGAIAMYLLRDQAPDLANPSGANIAKIKGVHFEYFEANFGNSSDFNKFKPVATGVSDNFSLDFKKRNDNVGFKFTGFVSIPSDGEYTFHTRSDDGSMLYIGDKLVVNNDGVHAPEDKRGTITLKAGDHPIMVTVFNGGAGMELTVYYEGPGLKKQRIPDVALSHVGQAMTPVGQTAFALDQARVARGRELFASLNCAACHRVGDQSAGLASAKAKPLSQLAGASAGGCLAAKPGQGVPDFRLADSQREVLQGVLGRVSELSQPLAPREAVAQTLSALNCVACHTRDGKGGPSELRAGYFAPVGDVDLGDEGRMPPLLTKVGGKLRLDWMRTVLLKKGAVRPYMATRMPQFGEGNVGHLPELFEKADGAPDPDTAEPRSRDEKFGRKLVGVGGLACITCHTFADHKSLGVPAIDLTTMTTRLKKDWFRRYLVDPAALRPGTRMPTFWPEGKASNKEILGGDTDRQIDAVWAFLARGLKADLPPGLVQGRMEIVPQGEAVIYRNFIAGAGSRAIGVGYPERVHLAFDANELRLALIWQGAFMDAARHSTGRGEGYEPPLGDHVVKLPAGAAFAVLPEAGSPWPQASGKKAGYQLKGYSLDDNRRPTFFYDFQSVHVADFPMPVAGELDASFRRTLTLRSEKPVDHLWFRAAQGSRIEAKAGGFVVDGNLTLKLGASGGAQPVVRELNGQSELLVPVKFEGNEARIVEELIW